MLKHVSASKTFYWDLFAMLGMPENFTFIYVQLKANYTFFEILAGVTFAESFLEACTKKV